MRLARLPDEKVARGVALYYANSFRLQWDFPRVVKELGLGPADLARLAAAREAYYNVIE